MSAATRPSALRVGYSDYVGYTPVPQAIRAYQQAHPKITIEHTEGTTQEQLDGLSSGTLEMGFFVAGRVDVPGVRSSVFWQEPLVLVLPEGHPLAAQAEISFHALHGQSLLCNPKESNPQTYAYLHDLFRTAAVEPQWVVKPTTRMHSYGGIMRLVAEGLGGFLIVKALSAAGYPGVIFRTVVDPELRLPFRMAWRLAVAQDIRDELLGMIRR
ncbi:LysR family substrate-binding domain-containing protein [Deinococcus hohokamensis]|uniref:LysR family substrate-binding domain-containing protein n=1 Tax=Deinococcus hohokamensis TaxID=309883 RepID=A0ABV9I5W3_9DEIO